MTNEKNRNWEDLAEKVIKSWNIYEIFMFAKNFD